MEVLRQQLQAHTASDELHFQSLNQKLGVIKDNHLFHIERDIALITSSVASLHQKLDINTKDTIENKVSMGWIIKIGSGAWAIALLLFGIMAYIVRDAFTR